MLNFKYLFAAILTAALASTSASAADYAVIINASNPIAGDNADTRAMIKRSYMKEMSAWVNGSETQPLARESGSAVQQAFHKSVLEMSDAAVNDHWLRLKQIKGETPPREVGSARILFRLVGKYEGAFSFVTAEEALEIPPEVKVLFTFSD